MLSVHHWRFPQRTCCFGSPGPIQQPISRFLQRFEKYQIGGDDPSRFLMSQAMCTPLSWITHQAMCTKPPWITNIWCLKQCVSLISYYGLPIFWCLNFQANVYSDTMNHPASNVYSATMDHPFSDVSSNAYSTTMDNQESGKQHSITVICLQTVVVLNKGSVLDNETSIMLFCKSIPFSSAPTFLIGNYLGGICSIFTHAE